MIDCKSLENFQGNVYHGIEFSKVESLQYIECNFTIDRFNHIFVFWNMNQELAILKRMF